MKKHLIFPICLLLLACIIGMIFYTDPYIFMGSGQRAVSELKEKIPILREVVECNSELLMSAREIYPDIESRIVLEGYDGFALNIIYFEHSSDDAVIHLLLSNGIEMERIISLKDTDLLTAAEKETIRAIALLMRDLGLHLIKPDKYHLASLEPSYLELHYFESEQSISEYRAQMGYSLSYMEELIPGWHAVIETLPKA